MTTTFEAAVAVAGDREVITRAEMVTIILAIGLPAQASTIVSTGDDGSIAIGDILTAPVRINGVVDRPATHVRHQAAVADAWATACNRHTCISLWDARDGDMGGIRHDAPGSMAPMQHADLMFIPHALPRESIDYLRGKAERMMRVK